MLLSLLKLCIACLLFGNPLPLLAQQTLSINNADAILSADVYSAKGDTLFLWLPPEGGFQAAHSNTAQKLTSLGVEVWLIDIFEARFLPPVDSSLAQIPADDVRSLLSAANQTGKRVLLVSSGHGILPLLRGAHLWQQSRPDDSVLAGAILISPKFYTETPDPGQPAELLPIVRHTNLPIFILQPRLSPWFWKLGQTVPALQQSGSDVFVRVLPEVRDRFYYRPDATSGEQTLGEDLPNLLYQAGNLLSRLPSKSRTVSHFTETALTASEGKKDRYLRPYQGDPQPPELVLPDIHGKQHDLREYRGQVVLVNFWASWCPPCVHEMPSMQRLAAKLGAEPFNILAVNMAETLPTIQQFLQTKVKVDFSVLLDQDGAVLQRWSVFAFPTSYVVDKQGRIRYALFGSVDWDSEEMLQTFSTLLREP